jgi:16S rRNA (guanine966-N2)-methyltransferase
MRIVAGAWRGRRLIAPAGTTTRPTSDRARQALFDMLLHAPWGGRTVIEGARVLDLFAGTGAMGLEALSRGAAHAWFVERDRVALGALHANISACGAATQSEVVTADALRLSPGPACDIIFLDPPYAAGLIGPALDAARVAGRVNAGALIIAESGRDEHFPGEQEAPLASRIHGAARITIWRAD